MTLYSVRRKFTSLEMTENFNDSSLELTYMSGRCLNTSDKEALKNSGIILSNLNIFVYLIWMPTISVTGVVGNTFSAIVLKKQFAKEEMYYFQLLIVFAEALTSFINCLIGIFYPFLFNSTPGPNFVKYNFIWASFICVLTAASNMFENSLILLITATNLDRLQVIQLYNNFFVVLYILINNIFISGYNLSKCLCRSKSKKTSCNSHILLCSHCNPNISARFKSKVYGVLFTDLQLRSSPIFACWKSANYHGVYQSGCQSRCTSTVNSTYSNNWN